jgi:hypothetical protein
MTALHALLANSIDYAGLFPPAGLAMSAAAANYAAYREGEAAWALGRFVVPAARLSEFEKAAATLLAARPAGEAWRLAALFGADPAADLRAIGEFNCRHAAGGAGAAAADVVEAKAGDVNAVAALLDHMPEYLEAYVEVPVDRDPALLVRAIAGRGGRAKIRTGGVTPEAFPSAAAIARFIAACVKAGVPFKATAGLHHPLRAVHPLTYAADSPRGRMFGFLNVFLAAAFMSHGLDSTAAVLLLEESDPSSLRITEDAVEWRGRRLSAEDIASARVQTIVSFGSCSFTEPLGDLAALGLLSRQAD